jgi:hypothetical protein
MKTNTDYESTALGYHFVTNQAGFHQAVDEVRKIILDKIIEYEVNPNEDFPFNKVSFDFVCRMRYINQKTQQRHLKEMYLHNILKDLFSIEEILLEKIVYEGLRPITDKYEFCKEIIRPTLKANSSESAYRKEVNEYLFTIKYLNRNADPRDLMAAIEYSGEMFQILEESTYLNSLEEIDEVVKTVWYDSLWDVCEEPITDMAELLFNNKKAWLEIADKYFEH